MKKTKRNLSRRRQKRFIIIIILMVGYIFPLPLFAGLPQKNTITGKITDNRNIPLPGVTVRIEGTTSGVVSDNTGTFTLTLPDRSATLIVSFIGFKTQRIKVNGQQTLSIRMEEDIKALEEVTVVAYGSQKTRNVVGAVSVLKAETFDELTGANLETSVQGRLAGVSVIQQSGAPGGGDALMEIRGFSNITDNNTGPLYVIDGIPVTTDRYTSNGVNPLSEIDSRDIQTFTVLKDAASAAIYGSRAANGVVIITTKHGRFNQEKSHIKASIAYSTVFSPRLPHLTMATRERNFRLEALRNYQQSFYDEETGTYRYPVSYEDAYLHNVAYNYFWNKGEGADLIVYQDSLNPFYSNNTNLLDYYFQTAHTLNANLQFSGGGQKMTYHVGAGFYQEKGTLRNTGFDRYNIISNLSFKPIENLLANLRIYMAYTNYNRSGKGQDMFNFSSFDGIDKIPSQLLSTSTVLPGPGTEAFEALMAKYEQTLEKNISGRIRGGLDISYTLFNSLTLKAFGAFDFNLLNHHTFQPSTVTSDRKSYSSEQFNLKMMCIFEGTANYNVAFGLHHLDLLGGYSIQRDAYTEAGLYGKGAPTDLIHYIRWESNVYDQETYSDLKDATSDYQKSILLGWFARVNYDYDQKYLFSASIRRDASSKFGEKVRWGTFPSVGVGYAVSEESFMDWADGFLDYAKVRASWGRSGRQFHDPDIAYGKLAIGETFLGLNTVIPASNDGLINQRLTWEETDQYNIGFDLNTFEHRLNFIFDYYYKYTDKLLYLIPLPGTHTGYFNQWRNAYALSNEGIEFTVSGDAVRSKDFTWNATLNISRNWNRLEKSYDGYDFINSDPRYSNNLSVIGKPLNGIYVYRDGGIYNSQDEVPTYYLNGRKTPLMGSGNQFYVPGDRIFMDADYNGRIESVASLGEDRVYAGAPEPKINWGFTNTFRYKTLSVEIHWIGAAGRTILRQGDNSLATYISPDPSKTAMPVLTDLTDKIFWQKPGDNAGYPRNSAEAGKKNFATNILSNVQNVHFAKLKNITVSYDLPQKLTDKIGFHAGIYVTAQNICTITNYKGPDPESVSRQTGVDSFGNYPLSRTVTIGLTLDF